MPVKKQERPKIFLQSVTLSGFKSIEKLYIDFQKDLNILIGKNGSGKSNFIEFINLLLTARTSKTRYNSAKLEFVSSDSHNFKLELQKNFHAFDFEDVNTEDRVGLNERFSVDDELVFDDSNSEDYSKAVEFKNKKIFYRSKISLRSFFSRLGYSLFYPLYIKFKIPDDEKLECVSLPGTLKINLESNFSTWELPESLTFIDELFFNIEMSYDDGVDKLKGINKINFSKQLKINSDIKENLKRFSNIDDIRFNSNVNVYSDDKSIIIDNIKIDFKVNGNWLPWSQLSDGTKRLFYIISEITNANGLVLIEEPELGVHPHQFSLLMEFLKEQSKQKQLIISTHSPKALDHLSVEELNCILIASFDKINGTKLRHLSNKEIKKAKLYMKEVGFFSDYWMLSNLE